MQSRKWIPLVLGGFIAMSAGLASAQEIVVRVPPPRAVVERRVPAPGRGYIWVPGYQRWTGNGYAWVPGRWELPPRPHARWVPYKWERRGHTWVLRDGRWR
jgi:WXXGXW repeat (2 copies)